MNLDDAIFLESYTKLKSFVDFEQASCIENCIHAQEVCNSKISHSRNIEVIDDLSHPSQKRLMIDDEFVGQIETLIDISSGLMKVKCEIK